MLRKTISLVLIVTYLFSVGCDNLPLPVPGIVNQLARDMAMRQLAAIWKDDIPITHSYHTRYPTVDRLPGAEFSPTALPLADLDDTTLIEPGDYEIPAHFYCTGFYVRNGSGYRYLLANLQGKFAEALTQLYAHASMAGTPTQDVQILSWSIQAGIPYDDLKAPQRALVDSLIPQYREQMSLGLTEKLMRDWNTWSSRYSIPSFHASLAMMGDLGMYIQTLVRARREILNKDYRYESLASVFAPRHDAQTVVEKQQTPWSLVQKRIYMRFIAPQGGLNDGVIQIRILDSDGGQSQASNAVVLTDRRPIEWRNVCARGDLLYCSDSAFNDLDSVGCLGFVSAGLGSFPAADHLIDPNVSQVAEAVPLPLPIPIPSIGAIPWGTVILIILGVIAVAAATQSLTASVKRPPPRQQPIPKSEPVPMPVPTVPKTPRPEPPPECVEQARRLSRPDFTVTARAGQSGGNRLADLFCETVTETQCEYEVDSKEVAGRARFDSIKGRDVTECKCGYKKWIEAFQRGESSQKWRVDKLLEQLLRHLRIARAGGLRYRIVVSNDTVAEFLRQQLGDGVDVDVQEFDPCD